MKNSVNACDHDDNTLEATISFLPELENLHKFIWYIFPFFWGSI